MSKQLLPKIQEILGIDYNWDQFPIDQYTRQVFTGSMGINYIIEHIVDAYNPKIIIEVGSWLGHSAIEGFGYSIKRLGLDCMVICVDTWLGSHFGYEDKIKRLFGYPTLYYQFLANVYYSDMRDTILPLPITSLDGGAVLNNVFEQLNVKADLIYIDGSHLPDGVRGDCSMYFDLLDEDGLMFGDDWVDPDVKIGVNQFLEKNKDAHLVIHPEWEYTWFIHKGDFFKHKFFKKFNFKRYYE